MRKTVTVSHEEKPKHSEAVLTPIIIVDDTPPVASETRRSAVRKHRDIENSVSPILSKKQRQQQQQPRTPRTIKDTTFENDVQGEKEDGDLAMGSLTQADKPLTSTQIDDNPQTESGVEDGIDRVNDGNGDGNGNDSGNEDGGDDDAHGGAGVGISQADKMFPQAVDPNAYPNAFIDSAIWKDENEPDTQVKLKFSSFIHVSI